LPIGELLKDILIGKLLAWDSLLRGLRECRADANP
jgi:hypothetical protein